VAEPSPEFVWSVDGLILLQQEIQDCIRPSVDPNFTHSIVFTPDAYGRLKTLTEGWTKFQRAALVMWLSLDLVGCATDEPGPWSLHEWHRLQMHTMGYTVDAMNRHLMGLHRPNYAAGETGS